jgi:hypothetical protein
MLFFLNLHWGRWSPNWVHSARRPLTGLLYLARVIVRMENLVEWMAGETELLGENLPRRHFVHHKSHLTTPGIEPPGRRGGKPATNRFSYGAAVRMLTALYTTTHSLNNINKVIRLFTRGLQSYVLKPSAPWESQWNILNSSRILKLNWTNYSINMHVMCQFYESD